MNKDYIIKLLKELKLLDGEYYIIGSSAMVIRGLRKKSGDLDLVLSPKAMEELSKRMSFFRVNEHQINRYKINDEIEFFLEPKENFKMEYAHGLPLEDIHVLLEYKTKRNEPKDIEDIKIIKEYINKRGRY